MRFRFIVMLSAAGAGALGQSAGPRTTHVERTPRSAADGAASSVCQDDCVGVDAGVRCKQDA